MSTQTKRRERAVTVPEIRARKGGAPVVCLTAYTAPMAEILDPHVDLLLVGDSLGMVIHGLSSTVPVTLEMMILHGAAVRRGASHALIVVDMPFSSYEERPPQAFRNAARILRETGASAVKLEGGRVMAETIRFLVDRGVPVMAHIGLQPQSVNATGGYRARGRREAERQAILDDARAVEEAGAFAVVVEAVAEPLGREITEALSIPTIGIGASASCDGQILVTEDMLGIGEWAPSFVKQYADLRQIVADAAARYAQDVKARTFPGPEHVYGPAR